MKEDRMVDKVQDALARLGVEDELVAAAIFLPRVISAVRSQAASSAAASATSSAGWPAGWAWRAA